MNLTINPSDQIAIVGESGTGKSTLISLLCRFYDPDFGQVLIDGEDIKQYDIRDFRKAIGLVMQEPSLFNTSIAENMLYGNSYASNATVREAAATANALEFIESNELSNAFDDDCQSLNDAFIIYSNDMKACFGDDFKKFEASIKKLAEKEKVEGKFESIAGDSDIRTEKQMGDTKLHHGFNVTCG